MIGFALALFGFALYGAIRAVVCGCGTVANRAEMARRARAERAEGEATGPMLRSLSSMVAAGIDIPPHVEHLRDVTPDERRIDVGYLNALYALDTHERTYR